MFIWCCMVGLWEGIHMNLGSLGCGTIKHRVRVRIPLYEGLCVSREEVKKVCRSPKQRGIELVSLTSFHRFLVIFILALELLLGCLHLEVCVLDSRSEIKRLNQAVVVCPPAQLTDIDPLVSVTSLPQIVLPSLCSVCVLVV